MLKKCKIYLKSGGFAPFYSKIILKKGKKYCKIKTHVLYCGTSLSSSNVATPSFDGDRCYTECKSKKEYKNDNTSCEVAKGVKEGIHMIDIGYAAKYLIQLFEKTEPQYECGRIKIEKLLSIAQFVSIKKGNPLFSDNLLVNQCGTGFKEIAWHISPSVFEGENDNSRIQESQIDETSSTTDDTDYSLIIPNEDICLLKDVFLNFGAYDPKVLGIKINDFVDDIKSQTNVDSNRPIVDVKMAQKFFNEKFTYTKYSKNFIIDYIFSHN